MYIFAESAFLSISQYAIHRSPFRCLSVKKHLPQLKRCLIFFLRTAKSVSLKSAQFHVCWDMVIRHQKMKFFFFFSPIRSRKQHAARFQSHQRLRRRIWATINGFPFRGDGFSRWKSISVVVLTACSRLPSRFSLRREMPNPSCQNSCRSFFVGMIFFNESNFLDQA